jgi:hypothetical protein
LQIGVHDTRRRLERSTKGINENRDLPESEKKKILAFDEFLAAKGFGE